MYERTPYSPLTAKEQQFAGENHYIVEKFLRFHKLPKDEWYDVVIFRYLLSVKKWIKQPRLWRYEFSTIAFQAMRSAVWNEREREKKRIHAVSLDEIVPGTEDVTYMETVTEENLKFVMYVQGEKDMKISYDVLVPKRNQWRGGTKSDEIIALEAFLTTRKMKNMRFEYDTPEEAKKKLTTLTAYRRKNSLKEVFDVFRDDTNIYVLRLKNGQMVE